MKSIKVSKRRCHFHTDESIEEDKFLRYFLSQFDSRVNTSGYFFPMHLLVMPISAYEEGRGPDFSYLSTPVFLKEIMIVF
jgi:hypothetical protein